ncbi:SGNH/GDSL hydrolase family protein [Priestia filamentosa]|uniref:SGNH/GDSL hydrolase family protein n=1 Tax=Priestia filamentosa TaxID=1402861 RepID=UPI00234BDC92|nr:SGNH/GDSL hydrolase family protein [Priestia filamentosa]WCM14597.1 SGNH/GDSL hydrolase family protein [Priestia filamentosa]
MGSSKTNLLIFVLLLAFIGVMVAGQMKERNIAREARAGSSQEEIDKAMAALVEQDTEEEHPYKNEKVDFKGEEFTYSPLGSSLTAGYYASKEDKKFASVLSDYIQEEMNYKVSLEGHSAHEALLMHGLDAVPEINKQEPDFVSVEFGTSDCSAKNNIPLDTFQKQLDLLVDDLTGEGTSKPQVVLLTTWSAGERCQAFDEAVKTVGEEHDFPVVDLSEVWGDSSNVGRKGVQTYNGVSDNLYPNDQGMKVIAGKIFEEVEGPLKERGLKTTES